MHVPGHAVLLAAAGAPVRYLIFVELEVLFSKRTA
jgi:hypothetical protein